MAPLRRPAVLPLLSLLLVLLLPAFSSAKLHKIVLKYYAHQQFNTNEFGILPAAVPAVNGTRQGVGLEVVYNYDISKGPSSASSAALGFIRGTSTVASNTVNATFFVANTVVHYSDPSFSKGSKVGLSGTFTTQGEADFSSGNPWEYAVTGGTGDFRRATGYAAGRVYSVVRPTANASNIVTTVYKTHIWLKRV